MKPQRLSVGIIGAGPVGCVLGRALASAGHIIAGIASTDERNLERADALIPGVKAMAPHDLLALADLVLIAIPAGEIAGFVSGAAVAGLWRPGQLVAHTAGEFGIDVLAPAAEAGAISLALHPAMAFTGTSVDIAHLHESYFAVEAPLVALPIAQALVIEMGAEPIVIEAKDRAAYFEAVSVAQNFSAMIVNQSIGLLEGIGIENARAVIAPVVRSSVDAALRDGHIDVDPDELLEQ